MSAHATMAAVRHAFLENLDAGFGEVAKRSLLFVSRGLRARFALRQAQHLGVGVRVRGHAPVIQNLRGTISIGDHVFFDAPVTPAYLDVEPGALLSIGDDSYINDGVWIGVTELVLIGDRARIAPGVRIIDSAYHGLEDRRGRPRSAPVVLEDDVWIATDSMIAPGVHIGRGAVIGAHSLVTKDVLPFTVVAGVPARPIRHLDRLAFEQAAAQRGPRPASGRT